MTLRDERALAAPRVRMPRGRHFALTWSIPDEYGGMTQAMLARCAAFARLGGVAVEVLTFDLRPDTPQLAQRLRERGVLVDGVRVTNLYDWLRGHPLPGGSLALDREVFTPIGAAEASGTHERDGRTVARFRRDAEGRLLQIDHLREDGSLVLSDRRDARERGVPGGRSLVLCDEAGRPVRSWRRIWPLYTAWLDALTAGQQSFMIADSKTIAPFLLGYRRRHVVTAHVVHASHRSGPDDDHPVRASRREVFEHLDDFDLVALLSARQREEVVELSGPHENVVVITNARPARPASARPSGTRPSVTRPRGSGVVLAALTPRKRVSHAIAAVGLVNGAGAGASTGSPVESPVELEVFGDGESRAALERRAALVSGVRLRGYDPEARRALDRASFVLLTSHSEGFPLVLVEAMAAGCLPIAYDIRYGPADLIRDGRNGFLVPAGDVEALAAAIARLQALPAAKVARMRRAAMRSARAFDEARVLARWSRQLSRALARRELRRSPRLLRARAVLARLPFAAALRTGVVAVRSAADRVSGAARR